MKTVLQRVNWAEVQVDEVVIGRIERGLLAFVCVEKGDGLGDALVTARKLVELRVFPGRTPMDLDLRQVHGAVLVISQFTLAARLHRGRRPSFTDAEDPAVAKQRYEQVCQALADLAVPVQTGEFAAHMQVSCCNDGPVTLELVVRAGAVC